MTSTQRRDADDAVDMRRGYKEDARQRAVDAADVFLKAINEIGFDDKAFAKAVCNDHRTLQQGAMRAFMVCIKSWADDWDRQCYDARNEKTCRISKVIMTAVGENQLHFPLI